jgi:hypothetical protein
MACLIDRMRVRVLAQDHGSIGDQRYDIQLVGRHHEGSTGRQPGDTSSRP